MLNTALITSAPLCAATPEEITLTVKEFIAQFMPQFLPTFEKYSIIFTGVVSGVALLVTIIVSIIRLKQSKNKLKAAVTPYEHNKELIDAVQTNILDKLTGTFDVDITNKINPVLETIVNQTNSDISVINDKLNAICEAQLAITKVFSNSGSLTQEEYNNLLDVLNKLPDVQAQKQEHAHVQVVVGEAPKPEKSKKQKITV